ncbi:cell surface protein [Bacillus cereus W]|uniref:isopeptide-forming domain-containing fimbrial protein n=1 Tax=Bacillus anthracis TaxID=1392 RepID=UPI00016B32EA|nr:isopeptide-forming domain-containing fimbrial protein [Bacillus anthracis]EDX58529.1 cell surface protein [Bacillus cereus W]MEB9525578.1 isopeptide-forming domain-containing fimbrial protein [Bacillus anthracis]MEC0042037.1 isopeptide-forming domain-containing fimbrial protein [Bacillus anthracis]
MKKSLKCFNVVTIIALLLSITLPSPSAFAEINKKNWDELQGNDVRIKAEQVNAEIYRGEVAEREHVFQYTIENTGDTPIQELVLKQNNENEITFLSQSMKVNGEKLPENKVADFYVEEKDKGGKLLSSNLKIRDLKSHEKMTVLIKASRTQHFNKEYKQKISVQKDQVQIGSMSFDVEGIPSEDKVEATADDEADSSKKSVVPSVNNTTKKVDEKLKVSVEDTNNPTSNTELVKQPVTEAEKQPEKEAAKQSNAEVQAASENASKVQIQVGDKQGFGDPLYSVITAGDLVQTGNVTLGLTTDHYGRQSLGYKTNKMTVDVDNDDSTFNSSTGAFPTIPTGSKVKKAYLFWTAAMGVPGNITDRKVTEDQVRQPVKMKMGNKQYAEVSADSIRKADYLPYISNYSGSGAGYVAYADVTNVIAQQGISQTLTVANVPQIKDVTGGGYYWGNWNLILVYENYKETVKDMKIWEGLVSQKSTAWTDVSVNKINTPKEGAFKAKFSYFSSQGDPAEKDGYAYDYGEYDFGAGYIKIKNINGKDNDANDSSMTEVQVDGTNEFVTKKYPGYNPDWTNSFSTDIHTYHFEGPNQVKNDLKEAKMRFRANGATGDIYVLNNATFVTEHNAPNLQVDKKALDSAGKEIKEVKAGEEITYKIEVKNDTKNNQAPVSNVKGFDKLDDRLEYVPGSIQYVTGSNTGQKTDDASDDEAEFVNNQIDFRIGEGADAKDGGVLKPGESAILTFKVKVKESIKSDTTVKNVVAVKGQDSAEIKYESEDDANVTVTTPKEVPGEIEARKIASNKSPKLGDEVEYRITFKNKVKDGRLDVLTIEDELPSSLEYVKDSLKAEGVQPEPVELKFENGKIIAKYPAITDMEERSIVFKTKVKETAKIGEEIVNKAIVSDKTNPPKNIEEKITPQHKAGKIDAKKKATNKKPKLGEEFEYQISFNNTVENGKLEAVTIEDEIPANLEFIQGSERAEGAGPSPVELKVENGKVIAKYPAITDTKERSIIFKVKVKEEAKAGETIVNKAVVSDPNGQSEHPEEKVTPDYKDGKVDVDKSVTNQTPKLGEEVEYRITFHNTVENGKLEKVMIEDTLPAGVEYVKDSLKAEGIKPEPVELKMENGKIIAKYPEIMDMEKRSIVFKVKVKDSAKVGEAIVNKAIAKDPKHDPVDAKVVITPQSKKGEIAATKVVNNEKPKLGEEIEYRISFHNTVENGKIAEVRVEDTIPKGLEYVENSIKAEGEAPSPVELTVEAGVVKAKYIDITDTKERSIVFKVKVKEEVEVGKEIVNKAIVDDTKHQPIEPEERITPQHKDGIINAAKIVDNPSPKLGEEVEYRISFKNTVENGKLEKVKIEDTIPNGLEYVKGSEKAEGDKPAPVKLHVKDGKVIAEYENITDTKERSIVFTVKVKEEAEIGKEIVNQAIVDDTKDSKKPEAKITPLHKDGKIKAKKSVNNETPKLGEEVEYRISFKNTVENGKLAEVKIEDTLPEGLEYVENSLKAEGAGPNPVELKMENGKVLAKYPEITDIEERSITFKVKVKEEVKVGEKIVNKAIVDDTKHDPINPKAEITPQYKDGKIEAEKVVNNPSPKLEEEVEYRISFKNTVEHGKLAEVIIEDDLPNGLEYVKGSLQAEGSKPNPVELKFENGKVLAKYPEITDTKERSITFKVKVKGNVSDTIINQAIVSDTKHPPETPKAEIIPQHKDGKLEAKKVVNNLLPKLGEEVEYRISFKNTVENGKLAEVKIEDTLPEGLEYVENSLKAEGAGTDSVELKFENGKILAKYPEITDTKERSITFKVKVKDEVKIGGKIVNKAIIDDTKKEPETPTAEITPQHKDGKVEAEKTVNNPSPKLGEEIEYRISFKNTVENGKLAEVKIEHTLPNGLEYVKDSLQAEGSKPNPVELKVKDGKVIAKYPAITDIEERSIVFKAKVKEDFKVGEGIVNKVVVDDTKDPKTREVTVTPEYKDGKLKAEKFVNNKKPKLGEEVEYRINFKNTVENGKLVEVKVEDEIPAGLEYVENSLQAEGSKPNPVELKFENGKVMAKYPVITDTKERSIVFKAKVKEEAEIGKEIVNKAIVVDTTHEPEKPYVEITPQYKDGKIVAEKVANNHKPKLGEEVEYRIRFKNTVENGKLAEVNIKDTLPKGLEYVEGSITAEGSKPKPVELKVENGKVTAKYPAITDTEERSIVFKAKVKESVKAGEEIVNEAIVDDTKNVPEEPYVPITPQYKDGKIEARKEVSNYEPKLGEEIEYRIIFNNTVKDGKLAEVKIEDEIPAGLEFVQGSEKAEGAEPKPMELKVENGKVIATYAEIMDTEERSIVFKVKVKESVTIGKAITNKAIIHVDDPNHPIIEPTAKITPQYKDGKVKADKKVSKKDPKLGEEIEYRISFHNTVKDGKLAEVKIEDEIPSGLEYVKDSLKAEGDEPAPVELKEEAGKVTAKYENITDTKERSIIFKVKVKDSVEVEKAIVNKAIVDDTKNPPERPEVDITPQHKDGKVKADKKVSKKDPKLGEEVEYRIRFKNTVENGKLAELKIEDQLPAGLEYVKDSLKAEGNEPNPVELKEEAGKITAKYENIIDTAERSISFKVKVTEAVKVGKEIVNKAIVDDHNPKNPPQKPEAIITPEYKDGKLKAEKTVNNPAPKLGEEVEYRITFRNVVEHGKVAKVKIKDELPTGLEFVEGSERAEGANPKPLHVKVKNGIVLAEYPEIVDTKERSIIFKVKVKEKAKVGEEIVNTAVVEDTINPPEQPNVTIQPQYKDGALQAEKTVSNQEPKLGEEVEYRISFENTVENGRLTEVKVEDEIPAGLEYVQDSIKSDGPEPNPVELKVENGKVTAKYPEITDMKKRSIIFKVKVQETVQVGKEIINKAIVDDNNPTTPPVESLIPITPQYKDGKLEARKEVSNHEPKLGEEIEYRITFNGTVDGGKLVDVKIEDEIPAGLEYVKDSLEAVGDKPVPTELKVENGKVTAKYPEITDTKERSIIFKAKVKETVKVGGEITNKAIIHVDDPNHPVIEPTATIKPEYKDGKLKAAKAVSNKEPKLGEEVEYRISFKNTVENGKVAEVKVEDEIPAGLEYVQDSLRFEGAEPNPVELKVEFGKVIAKYLDIADRKERSIIFKAKVKETVETGEKIVNKAIVGDTINQPEEPVVSITPQYKDGMLKAEKEVSNKEPKLGEEVEYRISFKNTVENGKLAEVKIEDQLPDGLEYVKDSVKAKGAIEVKVENGKLTAKYENIIDTKERNITFKVKVKEKAGEEIVNRAIVDDGINQPLEPTVSIKPKEPEVKPEDPKEPEVKPEDPKEPEVKPEDPKEPEVKPEDPKEPEVKPEDPKEPEVKPEDPKEPEVKPEDPKEPEVKPEDPKEPEVKPEDPKEPEVKPEDPKEPEVKPEDPKEPEVKPEDPKEPEVKPEDPKEPEVKPEDPKEPEVKPEDPKEPEVKPEDPKEPEVKPEDPKEPEVKPEDPKEPEVKPEDPKEPEVKLEKPEVRLEKLIKEPQVKVERELPKTGAASPWMVSVGAGISFLVGGVLFVLGRRRKQ